MKGSCTLLALLILSAGCQQASTTDQKKVTETKVEPTDQTSYYLDIHDLGPGKVTLADVEGAHQKDLQMQGRYGVDFEKYWVDEELGKVYCLSKAKDTGSITATHRDAHGLLPNAIHRVTEGQAAAMIGDKNLYIDVHNLGPGAVKASDVAGAHEKDLAVQGEYGVNFINYWVDERSGTVVCLSEASHPDSIKMTHQKAHGLIPTYVSQVKKGN